MQSYFQVVGMHWVIQPVGFVVGFYSNVVSVELIFGKHGIKQNILACNFDD